MNLRLALSHLLAAHPRAHWDYQLVSPLHRPIHFIELNHTLYYTGLSPRQAADLLPLYYAATRLANALYQAGLICPRPPPEHGA